MSLKRILTYLGGAALIGVVAFGVWWMLPNEEAVVPSVTPKAETLDLSVFQDQQFSRLRAATVPVPPAERGRGNPFSPPARNVPAVAEPAPVPPVDPSASDVGEPPPAP